MRGRSQNYFNWDRYFLVEFILNYNEFNFTNKTKSVFLIDSKEKQKFGKKKHRKNFVRDWVDVSVICCVNDGQRLIVDNVRGRNNLEIITF